MSPYRRPGAGSMRQPVGVRMLRKPGSAPGGRVTGSRGGSVKMRLIVAGVLVVFSLVGYFALSQRNPITGESQRVALTQDQEIALGLQAMPQLVQQHHGESHNAAGQDTVDHVGSKLLQAAMRLYDKQDSVYPFEFTLLADSQVVNAFALPGGQTFITEALFEQLETEGQLAGVLGHEIGHVVHRHGSEHLAKAQLTQGLASAAVIAAGDPQSGQLAAAIGQLINMSYGRDDELECDHFGVMVMAEAGYDPRSMIRVMEILAAAGGPSGQPEFFSTHPNPENRIERIRQTINSVFPNGVPDDLQP